MNMLHNALRLMVGLILAAMIAGPAINRGDEAAEADSDGAQIPEARGELIESRHLTPGSKPCGRATFFEAC